MAKNRPAAQDNQGEAPTQNFVLNYRRDHPKNRCSYGIQGNPGIVVFDIGLFAGSTAPDFRPPATITLDVPMELPKADMKAQREQERAVRAAEKAAKAQAKLETQQARAIEKQRKAAEALAKAQAKAAAVAQESAAAEASVN